jgi:hypothetical protein
MSENSENNHFGLQLNSNEFIPLKSIIANCEINEFASKVLKKKIDKKKFFKY